MTVTIHPTYEHLRDWIEQIPVLFATSGRVIYDARNQIRVIMGPDGTEYNVKRFRVPHLLNRLVYTWMRAPKAVRAYRNALRLTELDIPTPEAVACILCSHGGLLGESFLITRQSSLTSTMVRIAQGMTGQEELVVAFAQMTARMHEQGVLHRDYSPQNILCDRVDGRWQFDIVDINRLRFGEVGMHDGCRSFARLWGKEDFFTLLAREYAKARGFDPDACVAEVLAARKRFWEHRPHVADQYE